MAKNTAKITTYLMIDAKKYDEEFAPYLNSIFEKYVVNDGKYSFVMRTTNGETIYVIPQRMGMPNEAKTLTILLENGGETTKKNLEKITDIEVK